MNTVTLSRSDAIDAEAALMLEIRSLKERAATPLWADSKDSLLEIASKLQDVINRIEEQLEAMR